MKLLRKMYDQPYFLVVMATFSWAGNAVAGKLAVGHVSPFTLTFLRWFVVVLILFFIARKQVKQDWQQIKLHLGYLFILGATGFALFNNLMYLALTTTTAINATIIQSSLPLYIFILNFILFRVTATKYQMICLPITVLGVLLITTKGSFDVLVGLEFNHGDLMMLVAAMAYGIFSAMLSKKPDIHWLSFITILSCSAFVTSLPFTIWEIVNKTAIWPDLTGWFVIIYTAIFASLIAQSLWIRSIELIGVNATGMFINLVPLQGTLLAIILLGENFQLYHLIGMVLIIGGVSLSQRYSGTKLDSF